MKYCLYLDQPNVLVLDSLHIEADCGNSGDDLSQFQFVEDGGFTGSVKSDHEDPHLFLPNKGVESSSERGE